MAESKITVGHVIPLIGAYMMAIDKKLNKEFKSEFIFSYDAFAKNEQHLHSKHNKKNYPSSKANKITIKTDKYSIYEYEQMVKEIPNADVLCGIPPCAGLSMLNSCINQESTKSRGADADQNMWMFELIKFYIASKSKLLVFENAPGLVGKHGVKVIEQMRQLLDNNKCKNHKLHLVKTTTLNHGLPQHRQRSFCYIYNSDNFVKLKNKKNDMITYEDLFKKYTKEENDETQHIVLEHKLTKEYDEFLFKNKNLIDKVRKLFEKEKFKSVTLMPTFLEMYKKDKSFINKDKFPTIYRTAEHALRKESMGLGYWDGSPIINKGKTNAVISKNMFRYIHPEYDRFLTIRECMALMGYDDDFNISEMMKSINHICQSVPVNTAADSLRWAKEILNDKDFINVNSNIILQDNMKGDLENSIYELNNLKWVKIK